METSSGSSQSQQQQTQQQQPLPLIAEMEKPGNSFLIKFPF